MVSSIVTPSVLSWGFSRGLPPRALVHTQEFQARDVSTVRIFTGHRLLFHSVQSLCLGYKFSVCLLFFLETRSHSVALLERSILLSLPPRVKIAAMHRPAWLMRFSLSFLMKLTLLWMKSQCALPSFSIPQSLSDCRVQGHS